MGIKTVFELMSYAWYLVLVLQYLLFFLKIRGDASSLTAIKPNENDSKWIADIQPLFFILTYNASVCLVWFITRVRTVILIGIPLGGLLFYLSLAGDISYILFPRDKTKYSFMESLLTKNMIFSAFLSMIESFGSQCKCLKDFNDCSQFYALIEIVILCVFLYYLFYLFSVSIHVILGSVKWDPNNRIDQGLKRLRVENERIRMKAMKFDSLVNNRFNEMSVACRVISFIPAAFNLLFYLIINYSRQIFRNIRLFFETIMVQWINKRRESLQYEALIVFLQRTRHSSIIVSLCIVYIWLNFEAGDSILTKIIYGFSTIIIIPLAINGITSHVGKEE